MYSIKKIVFTHPHLILSKQTIHSLNGGQLLWKGKSTPKGKKKKRAKKPSFWGRGGGSRGENSPCQSLPSPQQMHCSTAHRPKSLSSCDTPGRR